MRLVIKIQITLVNKNRLGYLPKYKSPLPLPANQFGVQPYSPVEFHACHIFYEIFQTIAECLQHYARFFAESLTLLLSDKVL